MSIDKIKAEFDEVILRGTHTYAYRRQMQQNLAKLLAVAEALEHIRQTIRRRNKEGRGKDWDAVVVEQLAKACDDALAALEVDDDHP